MRNRIKLLFSNPFVCLFIVCIIAFWQVAFLYSGLHWDMLDVHLPWLSFMSDVLQSGELHYWNPYQSLGYPFHADMLSTWYPPALITARFIGFDLIILQWYFLLHVFVAGCGMYKLAQFFNSNKRIAFLAAVSYMLCGVAVSNAQHLFIITSLAWIPLVCLYYLRLFATLSLTDMLKLSVVTCFMITGGYPFLTVVTLYFILILLIINLVARMKENKKSIPKILFLLLLSALLTTVMCAPMVVGFVQVMPELGRGTALSIETAVSNPYTLNAFWFSLVPFSLGNNWEYFGADMSMVNIYSGILFFVFMVYGLWKKASAMEYIFFAFGIVCLLGSLAQELPFMKWMVAYVPLFSYFRFPALLRLFFIIGVIIFGARSLHTFLDHFERDKNLLKYVILSFVALITLLIFYGLSQADMHNLSFLNQHETFQKKLMDLTLYERLFIGGVVQLLLLLGFLFILQKAINVIAFSRNIVFLVVVDMLLAVQMNINYTVVDPLVDPVKLTRELKTIIPDGYPLPQRTSMLNAKNEGTGIPGIWRNVNNYTKAPAIDGFTSFWLNDYLRLEKDTLLSKMVLDNPIVYLSSSVFSEDVLAVHKEQGKISGRNLYFQKNEYAQLQSMKLTHASADTAYFLEFRPNKFRVKVIASGDQLLTILQSAYKGWQVSVAAKESTWLKSNYLFMSVLVPAGESEVEFTYENHWIKYSFIAAMVAFLGSVFAILFVTLRKKRLGRRIS